MDYIYETMPVPIIPSEINEFFRYSWNTKGSDCELMKIYRLKW